MPSGFLYLLSHVVVAVEVKHIGNQIKGILIVLNLGVEASQVKSVCEVFFVDLAKVFIASGRYELEKSVKTVLQGVPRPRDEQAKRKRTKDFKDPSHMVRVRRIKKIQMVFQLDVPALRA